MQTKTNHEQIKVNTLITDGLGNLLSSPDNITLEEAKEEALGEGAVFLHAVEAEWKPKGMFKRIYVYNPKTDRMRGISWSRWQALREEIEANPNSPYTV